ncbi:hypothetical protein HH303_01420 [Rhodospirillaceae bacterium KN72]|uniref:Uncharacterized protein n=1 Tax=Pacificispira spongiicola TaxID=2729598 RepID=A0A7Y0HE42_9PROT|nr:hypothetical protein [Pacificispira spongiicola]NMM43118.1 hypothetical protein [Pacificispira spongiicola]
MEFSGMGAMTKKNDDPVGFRNINAFLLMWVPTLFVPILLIFTFYMFRLYNIPLTISGWMFKEINIDFNFFLKIVLFMIFSRVFVAYSFRSVKVFREFFWCKGFLDYNSGEVIIKNDISSGCRKIYVGGHYAQFFTLFGKGNVVFIEDDGGAPKNRVTLIIRILLLVLTHCVGDQVFGFFGLVPEEVERVDEWTLKTGVLTLYNKL